MADPYEIERQRVEAEKAAKQAQLMQALQGAQQAPQLDTTQAITQAVLGIAPMILGYAIAKKRGLAAGANAGLEAATLYDERAKLPSKLSQAQNAARAKALQTELAALNKSDTSIGLAGANAQAAEERLGTQFENAKELEGVKQTNRVALEEVKDAGEELSAEAKPYFQKIIQGEDVSVPEHIATEIMEKKLDEYQRAQSQKIAKNAIDQKRDIQQSQFDIPGTQRVMGTNGKPMTLTKTDYDKASNWLTTMPKVNSLLDNIDKAIKNNDIAAFAQNKTALIETMKQLRNYGAAFTLMEMNLIESQLGAAADPIEYKRYIQQQMRAGKPVALFSGFRKNLQKDFVLNSVTAKTIPSGWKQVVEPDGVHFYQQTPKGLIEIPYQSLINEAASLVGN